MKISVGYLRCARLFEIGKDRFIFQCLLPKLAHSFIVSDLFPRTLGHGHFVEELPPRGLASWRLEFPPTLQLFLEVLDQKSPNPLAERVKFWVGTRDFDLQFFIGINRLPIVKLWLKVFFERLVLLKPQPAETAPKLWCNCILTINRSGKKLKLKLQLNLNTKA